MPFFVRRVSPSKWHTGRGLSEAQQHAVKSAFTKHEKGLSLWRFDAQAERDRIAAAVRSELAQAGGYTMSLEDALDTFPFLEIDEADVCRHGDVVHTPEATKTPVVTARALHHDLLWLQSDLDAFALWLAEARQPEVKRMRKVDMKRAFLALTPSDFDSDSARRWWERTFTTGQSNHGQT
jgi:hypothetical protein